MPRPRIALLSNPRSTGNIAQLPRIRAFCAAHPDVFHYEVEQAGQIGEAMKTIARVDPKLLVINGGDGTVQAALTELYNGGHFGDAPPPVAVLPSGKTNLIALDLGAQGDPVAALEKLLEIAQSDLSPHLVARELIALRCGAGGQKPVIGMFLGGAGLADTMLYCRKKIYPLGLPNGVSHALTALALAGAAVPAAEGQLPAAAAEPAGGVVAQQPEPFRPLLAAGGDHARQAAAVRRDQRPRSRRAEACRDRRSPASVLGAFFADAVRPARPFEAPRCPFRGKPTKSASRAKAAG